MQMADPIDGSPYRILITFHSDAADKFPAVFYKRMKHFEELCKGRNENYGKPMLRVTPAGWVVGLDDEELYNSLITNHFTWGKIEPFDGISIQRNFNLYNPMPTNNVPQFIKDAFNDDDMNDNSE